jgi:hypothetical protein
VRKRFQRALTGKGIEMDEKRFSVADDISAEDRIALEELAKLIAKSLLATLIFDGQFKEISKDLDLTINYELPEDTARDLKDVLKDHYDEILQKSLLPIIVQSMIPHLAELFGGTHLLREIGETFKRSEQH